MSLDPAAALAVDLAFLDPVEHGDRLGVAVSGGGDSMALLILTLDWARKTGSRVFAATVDHGLRPDASAEAAAVAAFCADRSVPHEILRWTGWDGQGNLQATAREARRALLTAWADRSGLVHVLLGHTMDDQAETVLMRLARGSGVDGLAGIGQEHDFLFLHPLLGVRRADLRQVLQNRGVTWTDDPSNDDPSFDRVRARQMLPLLADLGLTTDRLVQTAAHMRRARMSLWRAAAGFADAHIRAEGGDLLFDATALTMDLTDSAPRCLAAAIGWIGGGQYRPRFAALTDAAAALRRGEARTLHGVQMTPDAGGARLSREPSAASPAIGTAGDETFVVWDRRWHVHPPPDKTLLGRPTPAQARIPAGLRIGALGDAVSRCPDWRATGLPRGSLLATPAVFDGDTLVAAPIAGHGCGWTARIVADFRQTLLSH